ncbi:hypothetical protein [Streptomyces sp. NPDC102437]|uniref:hypothetical protein n=1 Tax=Streptomyces sp. NPDC102437 TaxID=3366175 RepID=UPI00381B934D
MSIVAERPVFVQATRPKAGLKEDAERWEREDTDLGPEAEPEGSVRRGRRLGYREDVPLTAVQSERLGELFAAYGRRVLGAVRARLVTSYGLDWAEAEDRAQDIAGELWLQLARRGGDPLLATGADRLDEDTTRIYLLRRARTETCAHYRLRSSGEIVVDLAEPRWRAVEAGPLVLTDAEMSERCEELLSALPDRLRAVMVEYCYGVPRKYLAQRLGIAEHTAQRLQLQAVAMLRGEDPAVSETQAREQRKAREREAAARAVPVTVEDLPEAERTVLEGLSDLDRDIILLRLAGVGIVVISRRLRIRHQAVSACLRRLARLMNQLDRARDRGQA